MMISNVEHLFMLAICVSLKKWLESMAQKDSGKIYLPVNHTSIKWFYYMWKEFEKEYICVYVKPNHLTVHLNCKSTILQ